MKPTMYLAGAIRDNNAADIAWREFVIKEVGDVATIWSPVAGKTFCPETKMWDMGGVVPLAPVIVDHDFWHVDNANINLFNFTALSEGYPNIGTLIEFGRATKSKGAGRCVIYTVIDPAYAGHGNVGLFKLHPFIQYNSSIIFPTIEALTTFLKRYLPAFTGQDPRFGGYVKS